MSSSKQKDVEQVNFISEVLQYANVVFKKGTELQKTEALDLLFIIAEEVEENQVKFNNVIQFSSIEQIRCIQKRAKENEKN